MRRRRRLAVAVASLSGCASLGRDDPGRLDLTVHNERSAPVTVRVTVVDDAGTTYEDASDRLDAGVARAFEVAVGTDGRHEATVEGDDWRGQLAWDAGTCAGFDGEVRVTGESVEVRSECARFR
jgi:hypothetical protein